MEKAFASMIVLATLCILPGCGGSVVGDPEVSLVGVWEMVELRVPRGVPAPPVMLDNKKDVYGTDGSYHDTAPYSTERTDTAPRTYTLVDGVVTVYDENGRATRGGGAALEFKSPKEIVLTAPDGIKVTFRKVSDDPAVIPKLPTRIVPIKVH